MILKHRLFERVEASREAKTIYIFCEGIKRESQYFQYFKEIDSRINIEIYQLDSKENNSPTGLYTIACENLIKSDTNPAPKYELIEDVDEVWFIIDTDAWGEKIIELREQCTNHKDWKISQSNPCFEVWLYYHFEAGLPSFEGIEKSTEWKNFLNTKIAGGFDSRKHPIFIEIAIKNSEDNYSESQGLPKIGCTQMFNLGKSIFSLTHEKLIQGLKKLDKLK